MDSTETGHRRYNSLIEGFIQNTPRYLSQRRQSQPWIGNVAFQPIYSKIIQIVLIILNTF